MSESPSGAVLAVLADHLTPLRRRLLAVLAATALVLAASMAHPASSALAQPITIELFSGTAPVTSSIGGGTPAPAIVVAVPHPAWATFADAQWVNTSGSSADGGDTGSDTTVTYATEFSLPPTFIVPTIAVEVLADNGTNVSLNGNEIGAQTVGLLSNFQIPSAFASSDATLFQAGTNEITFANTDIGGPNGVNFRVTVTYEPAPPDIIPPVISGSADPPANAAGWNNEPVTVTFTCVDEPGGSGVASFTDPVVLSGEGAGQSVTGMCEDIAGNVGTTAVVDINIDLTPPLITATRSPDPNAAGWNNAVVEVIFSCSDALSGAVSFDPPVLVGEGAGQSVTGACVDLADNSASVDVTDINVDLTAPTLAPVVSPNPVVQSASATVDPNAADALSGLADVVCDPVDTSTLGTHTVSCTAIDLAGNTATATATYEVIAAAPPGDDEEDDDADEDADDDADDDDRDDDDADDDDGPDDDDDDDAADDADDDDADDDDNDDDDDEEDDDD